MNKKNRKQPNKITDSSPKFMAGICRVAITLAVMVLLWIGVNRLLLAIMGKISEPQVDNSRIVSPIAPSIMVGEPELIPQDTRIATPWGTVERVISYSPFDEDTAIKQEVNQWIARGAKKISNPDENNRCLPETLYQMPDGRLIYIQGENESAKTSKKRTVSTYIFDIRSSNSDLFKDSANVNDAVPTMNTNSLDILPANVKPLVMGKIHNVIGRGSDNNKIYYVLSEANSQIDFVISKFISNAKKNGWNEFPQLGDTLKEIQNAKVGNELNLHNNKILVLSWNDLTAVAIFVSKGRNVTQINLKIRKYKL